MAWGILDPLTGSQNGSIRGFRLWRGGGGRVGSCFRDSGF